MERDPRVDPIAGDKLSNPAIGLRHGYKTITVSSRYPDGRVAVETRRGGRKVAWAEELAEWREWAKGARVIRAASFPRADGINFDFIHDAEQAATERWAGPWAVTVYLVANPASPWTFTLAGFPGQAEALIAAHAEINRRRRAGDWPPK
jgi:hypothetical protein